MGRYFNLSLLLAAVAGSVLLIQLVPADGAYYPKSDCCCNRTHNFFFGRRTQYDRLLYSNLTYVPGGPWKTSRLVTLPPRPVYPAPVLTRVEVLDSYQDGLGGCARIVGGGVGNKYVTLNLTSSPNHPISSRTNVYGHY